MYKTGEQTRCLTKFLNHCQMLLIGRTFHESVSTVAQHFEDLLPNYYCANMFPRFPPGANNLFVAALYFLKL